MSAHAAASDLCRIAAGAAPTAEQALHLAACAACRARLAAADPSALFGLLNALPAARPVPAYRRPSLTPRASRRDRPRVAALGAAAALLAVAALGLLSRTPAPSGSVRDVASVSRLAASGNDIGDDGMPEPEAATAVVAGVDSPTARIVTLVPPGGASNRATVTLILDEELDL